MPAARFKGGRALHACCLRLLLPQACPPLRPPAALCRTPRESQSPSPSVPSVNFETQGRQASCCSGPAASGERGKGQEGAK
jgi:hypothetical protein